MSAEQRTKIWKTAGAIMLAYVVGVWFLAGALGLKGTDLWVLRGGLWVLGLAAAAIIVGYALRQLPKETDAGKPRTDDIDAVLTAARTALSAARQNRSSSLGTTPVVVIAGATGSAKTTTVVRSSVAAELLAGDVFRGEATAPTTAANVWFAQGTVLVEAGGGTSLDATRWKRLVRHVQPGRLASAFGSRGQAPRSAVVCVSLEELARAGGAETVLRDARTQRERLVELSKALGVRLPVYVLFTKLDRLPHFLDYVQNLTPDEAKEVLGTTLPLDTGDAGNAAERTAKRAQQAFERLFQSLALRRLDLLPREHAAERRLSAYEFPRELRKLGPVITELLVELTRPSQLYASPFLRGFYFTGVQPVFVTDAPSLPMAQSRVAANVGNATHVFSSGELVAAASQAAAAPQTRKVPRWDFLDGVLRDVVLADAPAMELTRAGAKVDGARRVALALAAALALFVAGAFTLSWGQNRRLASRAQDLATGLAAAPRDERGMPTATTLRRLDSLHAVVATLRDYDSSGAPLGMRWGLYSGDRIRPAVERAWLAALDAQVVDSARGAARASLASLPDAPQDGADYSQSYNTLKGYLVATIAPERSVPTFMDTVLLARWTAARPLDGERAALARRQLGFWAEELRAKRIAARDADDPTVQHARTYLFGFKGADRIYQFMRSEAGKSGQAVQFNRMVPGSASYVVDRFEVPAEFTKGGWTFMDGAFKNAGQYLKGEQWVLGDPPAGTVSDSARVLDDLRARYRRDFVEAWTSYLASANVVGYGGLRDAAQKLSVLSGPQSPILALLGIASRNTAVGDTLIAAIFQPAQAVVSPAATDKLIGDGNKPYMDALVALQQPVDQASKAPPGQSDAAAAQASTAASAALTTVKQIAQGFRVADGGGVSRAVQRLLAQPINPLDYLVRSAGAGELNGQGQSFCAGLRPLLATFPFTSGAVQTAPLDAVRKYFTPESGAIYTYADALQKVVAKQGTRYRAVVGATPAANPALIDFLNRSSAFSEQALRNGVAFTLKPMFTEGVQAMTVNIDGQQQKWNAGQSDARELTWLGFSAGRGEARIAVRVGGTDFSVAAFQGPWAAFQLFHAASSWRVNGNSNIIEWDLNGRKIAFEMVPRGGETVMSRGYFANFSCPSAVVRP